MTKLVMADTRSENAEMDIGRLNVRIDKVVVIVMVTIGLMMINIGRLNVRIDKVVVMVAMMMFNILSHVLTPRWRRTLWWRSQRSSKCLMTSMQSLMSSCEAWNLQYILQL